MIITSSLSSVSRVWWCAVAHRSPSLPSYGVFRSGPVGHSQNRSIVEGQIERDSVECLEYDDEFCCGSDDDGRPLARWLHFGHRDPPPQHSIRDDNVEQLLVEGTIYTFIYNNVVIDLIAFLIDHKSGYSNCVLVLYYIYIYLQCIPYTYNVK